MHSDYDLQKGHLPDDVILLLIDQNPSGVPFLCKLGFLLLNPRRDNEMKRILVEEVKWRHLASGLLNGRQVIF